jgi:hypothetical protein
VAYVVAVLALVAVLLVYALWTARRLDRLHARTDAAATALQAQLGRRSAMAATFPTVVSLPTERASALTEAAGRAAATSGLGHDREVAESALTRSLVQVVDGLAEGGAAPSHAASEMHDEALRASFARRFYNDTVRDALVVRDRRVVRWLQLAGRAPHPAYFEMVDEELSVPRMTVAPGPTIEA